MHTPLIGKVAQRVVGSLKNEISALPPGSAIRSERELAVNLQVSRSTIRKALQYLEDKNLIIRRGRNGRYTPTLGQSPKASTMREEHQARIIFESALVGDISESLTGPEKLYLKDFFAIHRKQLLNGGSTMSRQEIENHNQRFHEVIVNMHQNKRATGVLSHGLRKSSKLQYREVSQEIILLQHELIVHAILLGDRNMTIAAVRLNLATELDQW